MRSLRKSIVALLMLTGPSVGGTINVPGDQPSIAAAINAANDGDTIFIEAGIYDEADLFIQSADISIIGALNADGSPAVTLDGQLTHQILLGIGIAGASGATIENVTFTGSLGNALWIYHHSPTIRNCVFMGNSAETQGTAVWSSSTEAIFESCQFIDNNGGDNGIIVFNKGVTGLHGAHGSPTFRDCLFEGNAGYSSVAAIWWDTRFEGCTFRNNTGTATLYSHQGNLDLSNNLFCENQGDPVIGTWTDEGGNEFPDTCPSDCMGDLNGDASVGVDDLLALLESYQAGADGDCDGDGDTDVDDLLLLVSAWGNCP